MAAQTIEELQVIITAQNKEFKRALKEVSSQLDQTAGKTQTASNRMSEGLAKVGKIGTTALKIGVVAGLAAITSAVPSAVRRIDTLNNSARTFENMGFKTKAVKVAVDELERSITGLPTPLDSAMRGMTMLAATYGDVKKGQEVFSSLNNAILGFGGTAADVDNAIQQLSQLPMDGPLDAQTWNSLRNSGLTPVLVAMAKESKMSVGEMKEAFGDGQLTVEDFTKKLIKMNEDGGGGLKSLEKIARDSTKGIGTTFANMRTAIVRSLAGLIEVIGIENINAGIRSIGVALTSVLDVVKLLITGDYKSNMFGGVFNEDSTLVVGILAVRDAIRSVYDAIKLIVTGEFQKGMFAGMIAEDSKYINLLFEIRNSIISIYTTIAAIVQSALTVMRPMAVWFRENLLPILIAVGKYVSGELKASWDSTLKSIKEMMPLLKALGAVIGVVVVGALILLAGGFALAVAIGATLINWISKAIGWFTKFFMNMIEGIQAVLRWVDAFRNGVISKFSSALNTIKGMWNSVPAFFRDIITSILSKIGIIPDKSKSIFSNAMQLVRNLNWYGLGLSIVRGIASGLDPGVVTSKMKSIASSAMDTVKGFLGIHSPSRAMRDEVGKMMGAGLAEGIEQSTKGVVRAATYSAKSAMSAYSLNTKLPASADISSNLEVSLNSRISDMTNRQIPVNINLDGERLLNFVIDGMNNKTFMSNNPVINI